MSVMKRSALPIRMRGDLTQVSGTFAWDLDFWGKYRRMIEASRANLLASQWARQEVITTLIADVAGAYFQLRELDMELDISKSTLKSRQESLDLTKQLADHGSASMLDVRQAEQLVYTAAENVPDLERRIQQQENLISVLLGNNPDSIDRGWVLDPTAACACGSCRNSFIFAGAPAGYPASRATIDRF